MFINALILYILYLSLTEHPSHQFDSGHNLAYELHKPLTDVWVGIGVHILHMATLTGYCTFQPTHIVLYCIG